MSVSRTVDAVRAVGPLADALQMPLMVNDQRGKLRIVGDLDMELATGGVTFDVAPKVVASGVSKTDVWVLVHIKGMLYIWLNHSLDLKKLHLWIVRLPEKFDRSMLAGNMAVTEITQRLEDKLITIYERDAEGTEWTEHANSLGGQSSGVAEEQRRQDHRGSGDTSPRS